MAPEEIRTSTLYVLRIAQEIERCISDGKVKGTKLVIVSILLIVIKLQYMVWREIILTW